MKISFHVHTEVDYLYRDASNYKFRGTFLVSGMLTRDDLQPHMIKGQWLVPMCIGLRHLLNEHANDDDHQYHENCDFKTVEMSGVSCLSANQVIDLFALSSKPKWHYS